MTMHPMDPDPRAMPSRGGATRDLLDLPGELVSHGHDAPTTGLAPEGSRFRGVIDTLVARGDVNPRHVRVRHVPAVEPVFAALEPPLPGPIARALAARGIERLYTHQVDAIASVRAGRHTVVVSRTASGKSQCFQVPLVENLLDDPQATALLLYPTKALAQDQLRAITQLTDAVPELAGGVIAGTYDGDTSGHTRRKLRDQGNVILTNPDMMHVGLLPYHSRWFRFLERLKLVVIDEMHVYRGIFGSHVAQVLRRLRRVFDHYGISPTFIFCSATIGNPGELARQLLGEEVVVVDRDGAPQGPRTFVFWNPPYARTTPAETPGAAAPGPGEVRLERRSGNLEAEEWLTELVTRGHPTIVFTKSRVVTELVYRYATETLARQGKGLADRIKPYRSGYLPSDRRDIERRLFSGDLLGVVATSALELGIDVGGLDAAVLVGFPDTIAATLQRAGRAGRSGAESLVVIVAYNEPIDQYLVRRPEELLGKNPEHAVVDLDNPYILAQQLACASAELPLSADDTRYFGKVLGPVAEALEADERVQRLEGSWYWAGDEFPAAKVSLRSLADDTYTIVDVMKNHGKISKNATIGTVDSLSAMELLYPEAIYLHDGRAYFVRELDLEQKIAYVEPREVDYYTQSIVDDRIRVVETDDEKRFGTEVFRYGSLDVEWATVAFKKIQFKKMDSIGYHALELPQLKLSTTGFWIAPDQIAGMLKRQSLSMREGLCGLRNVIGHIAPRYAMCDRQDLGTTLEASAMGLPTLYVWDRYPGGLGFAEKSFELLHPILTAALDLVDACECTTGCPSCVGVPPLDPGIHDDPETRARPAIPGKAATRAMLAALLGREGSRSNDVPL